MPEVSNLQNAVLHFEHENGVISQAEVPLDLNDLPIVGTSIYHFFQCEDMNAFWGKLSNEKGGRVRFAKEPFIIAEKKFEWEVIRLNENESLVALRQQFYFDLNNQKSKADEKGFRHIFETIHDIYYRTDKNRRIRVVSPSVERITGVSPNYFIGKTVSEIMGNDLSEELLIELLKNGRVEDLRMPFTLPSGESKIFSVNIQIEKAQDGAFEGTNGIIRDITSQIVSQEKLIKSEKQFKEIFESISDVYYRTNSEGFVDQISPSVEQVLGYTPEEMIGQLESMYYLDPSDCDWFNDKLKEKKRMKNAQGRLITKDQKHIMVSVSADALFTESGEFDGAFGVIRDISRENNQNMLTQLNRDILEKVTKEEDKQEILHFACKGIEMIYPEMICSILLYDEANNWLVSGAAPSLPKGFLSMTDRVPVGATSGSCGTAVHFKKMVIVTDIENDPLWESIRDVAIDNNLKACWSSPIVSSNNRVLGTFAIYYTEKKEPQDYEIEVIKNMSHLLSIALETDDNRKELERKERRYRNLVNTSPMGILIHTMGIIKFVNTETLKMLKVGSADKVIGQSIFNFIADEDRKRQIKLMEENLHVEVLPRREERIIRWDNSPIDVEIMGSSTMYKGKPSRQIVLLDITERKALEEQQNKLNEYLIKQNKQLEEFAHIASHNLRAPIANISSLLKIYEMDDSLENQKFVYDQLVNTSKNLNETIDELTNVIRTSWEINKNKQKTRFSTTLDKVMQLVSSDLLSTGAKVDTCLEQVDHVEYPKVYLESILQNLLSNSLKYSHPERTPEIKVTSRLVDGKVILKFKDNGRGIDMKKHGDKLFGLRKTFHQNENARGIGLFITKAQVESMGGDIRVVSEVDMGTEFIINLGAIAAKSEIPI